MNELRLLCISIFIVLISSFNIAMADDMLKARSTAEEILIKMEQGKNKEVWESYVSDWFKNIMTEAAFLANMTMIRAQLGASSNDRKLIQQNKYVNLPASNYKGDVFSFTFATTYTGAKVYEQIGIILEGNSYKLSGFNFIPNPN